MESKKVQLAYNDLAPKYNRVVKERDYIADKKISKLTIKHLKKKKAIILNLGCGTGLSSLNFLNEGYEVIGIDFSEAMIKEAKKLPFRKLICQNIEMPLKVENNHFDAVIITGAIEFIKQPLKLFKEITQV